MKIRINPYYALTTLISFIAFFLLFEGHGIIAGILLIIDLVLCGFYTAMLMRKESFLDYINRKRISLPDRIFSISDIETYSRIMKFPMISEEGETLYSLKIFCFNRDRDEIGAYLFPRLALPMLLQITSVPVITEYSLKALREAKG